MTLLSNLEPPFYKGYIGLTPIMTTAPRQSLRRMYITSHHIIRPPPGLKRPQSKARTRLSEKRWAGGGGCAVAMYKSVFSSSLFLACIDTLGSFFCQKVASVASYAHCFQEIQSRQGIGILRASVLRGDVSSCVGFLGGSGLERGRGGRRAKGCVGLDTRSLLVTANMVYDDTVHG